MKKCEKLLSDTTNIKINYVSQLSALLSLRIDMSHDIFP